MTTPRDHTHAGWGRPPGVAWVCLCTGTSWEDAFDRLLAHPDSPLYPDKLVLPRGRNPTDRPGQRPSGPRASLRPPDAAGASVGDA